MARRGGGGSSIPAPIMLAIGIAIGLLIIAAVITLAPGLGSQIESATPATGVSSTWNATCRTGLGLAALPRGSDFFASNIGLVTLIVVVSIITIALAYLVATGRVGR